MYNVCLVVSARVWVRELFYEWPILFLRASGRYPFRSVISFKKECAFYRKQIPQRTDRRHHHHRPKNPHGGPQIGTDDDPSVTQVTEEKAIENGCFVRIDIND